MYKCGFHKKKLVQAVSILMKQGVFIGASCLPMVLYANALEPMPTEVSATSIATESQMSTQMPEQKTQEPKATSSTNKFEPLQFEDLEHYDFGEVNQSMLDEVYQIAEKAKQDAQVWKETGEPVYGNVLVTKEEREQINQTLEKEVIAFEKIDEESLVSPIDVNQLMQQIQVDGKVLEQKVEQTFNQNNSTNPQLQAEQNPEQEKKSWFKRWREKNIAPTLAKVKYIDVRVQGAKSRELEDNLKAKLSTITVDAFAEYQYLLPQFRTLATQAAQAVGYYDAQFKFKAIDQDTLQVLVEYQPEPVVVKSQEIEFSGAGEYLPQFQIVNVIPDLEEGQVFNHGLYEKTKERINDAANSNGFFDSYWRLHDVKVELPDNTAEVNLKYETGERYKLGNVEFKMSDGSKELPVKEQVLKDLIPWKEGDDYTSWRLNLFSNHLTNTRFFNQVIVNEIRPEPIEKDLELPTDVVQQLAQQQNISAKDKVVKVNASGINEEIFAGQDTNDTLVNAEIIETEQDLEKKQIELLQKQARAEKTIPIVVTLNADQLNSLETGLGYGTDTGVRLRSQYRRAIVNKYGHSFLGNIELSKIRQAIDGRYSIPHKHAINQYVNVLGGYDREDNLNLGQGLSLVTQSAILGADYVKKTNRFDSWQHELGFRFRFDKLSINGDVDPELIPAEFIAVKGSDSQQSLLLNYKTSKIYADSAIFPTKGFKHHYKVELGSKNVLSDVDIAILTAGASFIYSLGNNDDHQFIGRADASYMFTNEFSKVPYNLRFFSGGDQSIRGFDYKSLSPVENGFKVGGQALAVGSLEYNYQVKDGWRVGVFSDFGNSFTKDFSNPMAYSAGLGVRWKSPVGTVRVDVAAGLSDSNTPIRLHFFIGPQF